MARIERFEDIEAWKAARTLTKAIYDVSSRGAFAKDFVLRDQARRAAVSVMANIAEGFERGGDKEFLQFLSFAKASCGELRSHLYVADDQNYLPAKQCDELRKQSESLGRMLSRFMEYLRKSNLRGNKFRDDRPKRALGNGNN